MVCCKAPVHVFCLRSWFRTESINGEHPKCPHCHREVNRIHFAIRIPSVFPAREQTNLLSGGEMRNIIRDMYTRYINTIEEGLHNRLRAFTFRNVDSFFLERSELENNGRIFLGFENRFVNVVLSHIKTHGFRKQFVIAIALQIPGWTTTISDEYVENLFYSQDPSTTAIEISTSILILISGNFLNIFLSNAQNTPSLPKM